jgi:hypothetical protein
MSIFYTWFIQFDQAGFVTPLQLGIIFGVAVRFGLRTTVATVIREQLVSHS